MHGLKGLSTGIGGKGHVNMYIMCKYSNTQLDMLLGLGGGGGGGDLFADYFQLWSRSVYTSLVVCSNN